MIVKINKENITLTQEHDEQWIFDNVAMDAIRLAAWHKKSVCLHWGFTYDVKNKVYWYDEHWWTVVVHPGDSMILVKEWHAYFDALSKTTPQECGEEYDKQARGTSDIWPKSIKK